MMCDYLVQVGEIYELRLMMDFSGSNRGFCFVRYTTREDAKRAVKDLNNFEIRPNKFLGILHSVDNRKLWISGIPRNLTSDQIMASYRSKLRIYRGFSKRWTLG